MSTRSTKQSSLRSSCGIGLWVLAVLVGNAPAALAMTELVNEGFETDGEGTRYTSNSFSMGSDYFERTMNPHPGQGGGAPGVFIPAIDGMYMWASEDVDGGLGTTSAVVRLADLDVSMFMDFEIVVALAVTASQGTRFEDATSGHLDQVLIQYAFDSASGGTNLAAGSYTTIGRFAGSAQFGGFIQEDVDLDTVADVGGAALTNIMTDYSYAIPAPASTPTSISVQIVVDTNGGTEEISFDSIRVMATPAPEPGAVLLGVASIGALSVLRRRAPRPLALA